MAVRLYLCRASVEKAYAWKERDAVSQGILLGFLEVWGECPRDGTKGYVDAKDLSRAGQDALSALRYFKNRGWIS